MLVVAEIDALEDALDEYRRNSQDGHKYEGTQVPKSQVNETADKGAYG